MPKKNTRRDSRKRPGGHQAKSQPHRKLLSPDEPDVSSILKVPGIGQTEEADDIFDHPLHSTAVSDYEEEKEKEEGDKDPDSEPDGSASNSSDPASNSSDSEPKKKKTRQSTAVSDYEEEEEKEGGKDPDSEPDGSTSNSSDPASNSSDSASNSSDSELKKKKTRQSKDWHSVKSRVEKEDSRKEPLMDNMRAAEFISGAEKCKLPSALSLRSSSSHCTVSGRDMHSVKNFNTDKMSRMRAKSQRKQKEASPEMDDNDSDVPHLVKVGVPKRQKKGTRRVTEYHVILDEFEKVTAKYKQGVEQKICRKAIDSFYTEFRDHLINTIAGAEELKKTKLKNMKMVRETNKKRQRLIEVKDKLTRTEPQLKKLKQEHAELKEKLSSLRNAMQLVTDLKDLQQKYVNERKENPQENVVYGISSLPALLVESQRILGAEGHFRNINKKLQQALNLQKEN